MRKSELELSSAHATLRQPVGYCRRRTAATRRSFTISVSEKRATGNRTGSPFASGARTSLRGPVPLTIQICGVTLSHPVYFCKNVKTFLLGYDVVSAAALVIDT